MVPEQAIHEGILRLHHCITSTKHSSGAEERYAKENIVHYGRNYMFAYIWRDLESDINWKTELKSTNQ